MSFLLYFLQYLLFVSFVNVLSMQTGKVCIISRRVWNLILSFANLSRPVVPECFFPFDTDHALYGLYLFLLIQYAKNKNYSVLNNSYMVHTTQTQHFGRP